MNSVISFLMILGFVASFRNDPYEFQETGESIYNVQESTFNNYVDHINHFNNKKFKQRYWFMDDLWDKKGPMFVYICGESRGKFPSDSSFFMKLVKKFNGIGVALEHRYYGDSVPVKNLSLDNLQYLSHTQALADLAYFVTEFKKLYIKKSDGEIKVFCVGGSYAGALSAWARFKYPHIFNGALSSSGVVNAILDFNQFDRQVALSVKKSGNKCLNDIHNFLMKVRLLWNRSRYEVMRRYKAPFIEWEDFMFYFSDIFVESVQYGGRSDLCKFLSSINIESPDAHDKLYEFGKKYRTLPKAYTIGFLRTIKINPTSGDRQWTYQYCSSLAYFNTPSNEITARFKEMNLRYWKHYCRQVFGKDIYPDTFHTNSLYSDVRIIKYGSKIMFTNGGEDPWQWAGIRE